MNASPRQLLGLPLLAGALLLLAYARVFAPEAAAPLTLDAEQLLFAPEDTSAPLVVAIAGWLLWRRRQRIAALPPRHGTLPALPFLLSGFLVFLWAERNAAYDLLALSLALHAAGFVCLARGPAAWRLVALPCVVLLLAIPLPSPLYNDLVWQLQLASASSAQWLLDALGFAVHGDGVVFTRDEQPFLVIEECSGLRSIRTLLIVALVVRELLGLRPAALALLAGLAIPLGLLLNVLRIAIVAAGSDASALTDPGSHVGQGLAVLVAGTALLFGLGHRLARDRTPSPGPSQASAHWPWRLACAGLAVQAAIAFALPPWPVPNPPLPDLMRFPMQHAAWRATDAPPDRLFYGQVPIGQVVQRRYALTTRRGEVAGEVDLFIGVDAARLPRLRPWSPKLALPARDWALMSTQRERVWTLLRDVTVARARRGEERALVYVWTQNDQGTTRETLRSLFALERGPLARTARRIVVRLSTPIAPGELSEHSAKRILDRFIGDFREPLTTL